MEYWNRLPGNAVETPSIGVVVCWLFFFFSKTRLDVYLYNLLYGSCFGGAVRIDDLLRSLPIQDSLVLWVGSFCARISSNSSAVLLLENSEQ